jgi:S-adenosylmethionine/arginine decarboxylase-like enzyme
LDHRDEFVSNFGRNQLTEIPEMNIIDGLHLLVDGNVQETALFEEANLDAMFRELVAALSMELIFGPYFKKVEIDPSKLTGDKFQDEGGLSAFAMISTSHISIHCWPLRRTFMADIFSCKLFSHETALRILESRLQPTNWGVRTVVRRPNVVY